MAKILLVHPLFLANSDNEAELTSPYFPLGLLYLAGYVRQHGHEVCIFDGTFQPDETSFDDTLKATNPDLIGISTVQTNRAAIHRLAATAANYGPVVAGGPDATVNPDEYLSGDHIELVVHHEGERTMVRLLDLIDQGQFTASILVGEPGVALVSEAQLIVNGPYPPIEDLDELPLPARDLIDMDRYLETWETERGYSSIPIATSRGCPFGCEWCRDSVHGDGFRQRSPESVAAEVQSLSETYDVEQLRFVDDVNGIDRAWFDQWATASDRVGASIPFEPLGVSDRADLPLLEVRDSL